MNYNDTPCQIVKGYINGDAIGGGEFWRTSGEY